MIRTLTLSIVFIFVAIFPSFAQDKQKTIYKTDNPTWMIETHNKCKVWNDLPFEDGINPNYTLWWGGMCKNGIASGAGRLQWTIPDRNDPINIPGLVFAEYDGPIVDGKLNGKGKLWLSSSYTYTGDFVDGQVEGYGTESFASGNRFVGLYSRGDRNGHGTLYLQNGDKVQCEWKDDKKQDGFMIYDWADGDHFEGYEIDNEPSGHGFLIDKTGKHEGEWVKGELTIGDHTYTIHPMNKAQR